METIAKINRGQYGITIVMPRISRLSIKRMFAYSARYNLATYGIDCATLLDKMTINYYDDTLYLGLVGVTSLSMRDQEKFPTLFNVFCTMLAEQYNILPIS